MLRNCLPDGEATPRRKQISWLDLLRAQYLALADGPETTRDQLVSLLFIHWLSALYDNNMIHDSLSSALRSLYEEVCGVFWEEEHRFHEGWDLREKIDEHDTSEQLANLSCQARLFESLAQYRSGMLQIGENTEPYDRIIEAIEKEIEEAIITIQQYWHPLLDKPACSEKQQQQIRLSIYLGHLFAARFRSLSDPGRVEEDRESALFQLEDITSLLDMKDLPSIQLDEGAIHPAELRYL